MKWRKFYLLLVDFLIYIHSINKVFLQQDAE